MKYHPTGTGNGARWSVCDSSRIFRLIGCWLLTVSAVALISTTLRILLTCAQIEREPTPRLRPFGGAWVALQDDAFTCRTILTSARSASLTARELGKCGATSGSSVTTLLAGTGGTDCNSSWNALARFGGALAAFLSGFAGAADGFAALAFATGFFFFATIVSASV